MAFGVSDTGRKLEEQILRGYQLVDHFCVRS